jgi:hypothetical protein
MELDRHAWNKLFIGPTQLSTLLKCTDSIIYSMLFRLLMCGSLSAFGGNRITADHILIASKLMKEFRETSSRGAMKSWCCYITVDSATTAIQNGARTFQCILKQMHYKTPFSH